MVLCSVGSRLKLWQLHIGTEKLGFVCDSTLGVRIAALLKEPSMRKTSALSMSSLPFEDLCHLNSPQFILINFSRVLFSWSGFRCSPRSTFYVDNWITFQSSLDNFLCVLTHCFKTSHKELKIFLSTALSYNQRDFTYLIAILDVGRTGQLIKYFL